MQVILQHHKLILRQQSAV